MIGGESVFDPSDDDFEWSEPWENKGDQQTEEWFRERAGKFTGSAFADLKWDATSYKSGPRAGLPRDQPQQRWNEIDRVVAEILCDGPKETVSARALEYGKKTEPFAVGAYEERVGRLIEQCGFIRHPEYPFAGCSPDFLLDDDGGGEIKCPLSIVVHMRTLREGLPEEHVEQIMGALWVTGRMYWEFISYNPRFPGNLALYVQRVYRDESKIAEIKRNVLTAWDQAQAIVARMRALA